MYSVPLGLCTIYHRVRFINFMLNNRVLLENFSKTAIMYPRLIGISEYLLSRAKRFEIRIKATKQIIIP